MAKRIQRVKPVWRVFWDAVGSTQIISGAAGSPASNSHDLVTAAEVEDLDDNCLVKRIVGEITFVVFPQTPAEAIDQWWFHLGFMVEDDQYDATTFQPNSAVDVQDAPWMWLRANYGVGSSVTRDGGNAGSPVTDVGGILSAHIDIKVARKMRAGDVLRLKTVGQGDIANWSIRYHTNLRILLEA